MRKERLELSRVAPPDPKSGASAISPLPQNRKSTELPQPSAIRHLRIRYAKRHSPVWLMEARYQHIGHPGADLLAP
ncbi:MAG: hypothetical protein RLZZ150_825 [Bacteroidota bacterium]